MAKNTHTGYRSGKTGQFITRKEGEAKPSEAIKESIPNPGRGDTGRAKKPGGPKDDGWGGPKKAR